MRLRIDALADSRTDGSTQRAAEREQDRGLPHDKAVAQRVRGADCGRRGHGHQRDRDRVGRQHAEAVDQQRHREDRAAAPGEAERDADDGAASEGRERRNDHPFHHASMP